MPQSFHKEWTFQLLLHLLLLVYFYYDKHSPHLDFHQIVFFANYALVAWVINYLLLPHYYYTKKYGSFAISVMGLIALVILMEELVLEQIFFADSRGRSFPGVFYTLVEVLPPILILTGFKFAWDAHQKHRQLSTLQQTIKESELRFLKSQINPHFLFNNLNNLYSYALNKSPKTPSIILELSAALRYMLYDCKENFVPLKKEIKHLKNYSRLSELQIEERGRVTFEKKPFRGTYQIAPLILSVFIENAFKHSTSSQNKDITIDIKISVSPKGVLHFKCKNSFMPEGNTEGLSKGIGLENVKKRLALIYPHRHQLKIDCKENIYRIKLKIVLDKSNP